MRILLRNYYSEYACMHHLIRRRALGVTSVLIPSTVKRNMKICLLEFSEIFINLSLVVIMVLEY
jgi:hypothetical protein